MVANKELVEKDFTTSDMANGGLLNPEDQKKFITYVKKFSVLLSIVRFKEMSQASGTIDKMHISEPITKQAAENTANAFTAAGAFNDVDIACKKVFSGWVLTTETLQENIEKDNFEDTLFLQMGDRISSDLELLGLQGDTTIATVDPTGLLLKTLNGWGIQSNSSHVVDAAGATIDTNHFSVGMRSLPKQYKKDNGLRWIVSDTIAVDWMNLLSQKGTALGDSALRGNQTAPFGRPLVQVPYLPDDLSISVTAATPAYTVGNLHGPFTVVTGTNDAFSITDSAPATTAVLIAAGTWDTVAVVNSINTQLIAGGNLVRCRDDGYGRLAFYSTDVGGASKATTVAGGNDFLLPTAGVTIGVNTGGAAGAGSENEGTYMLYTNPKNLIFAMLGKTRVYAEFNSLTDRIETSIYNQVDYKIENLDAMVKVINIRVQPM